ncbi:hypothetical protein N9J66_01260 [Gammaproteobacteria bacterium]|nr:hypothetical protein [Gammaproteobacteria bacterium]
MASQVVFMVVIIPVATVNLTSSDLALWLSSMLLVSLSSAADFGVYNTMIRTLPFVKKGKDFPLFQSTRKEKPKLIVLNPSFNSQIDIQTRIAALFSFGLRQLFLSVTAVLPLGMIVGIYIYEARIDSSGSSLYALTILFYWLVIPAQVFARFFESILMGSGYVTKAKQNEAFTVALRVIVLSILMLCAVPVLYLGVMHLIATSIQLALNFSSVKKNVLINFEWRSIKKYLSYFSSQERSSFTKGQYRFGVNVFSSYLIMNAGSLTVTGMKSDETVSFYLVMVRMFQAMKQFAQVPLIVSVPKMVKLRAEMNIAELLKLFNGRGRGVLALYFIGLPISFLYLYVLFEGSEFDYIFYSLLFAVIMFLELNHSNHAQLVLTKNVQPFVVPSFLAAGLSVVLMYPIGSIFGILGIILVQALVQLACSNWYPIYLNIKEFDDRALLFYKNRRQ